MTRLLALLLLLPHVLAARSNGTGCPAALALIAECACEVWLSGLRIVCNEARFPDLVTRLNQVDLPISSLRLRNTRNMSVTLPPEAFGRVLIKELDISENGLAALSKGALRDQESSLRLLRIANSSFISIPDLTGFKILESLDLTGNDISYVADNFPGTLTQLRLKNNRICNLAPSAIGSTKNSLIVLDLSGNCLRAVPTLTLRGFPKLGYLDLSRNDIGSELGFQQVVDLPALRELRLADNPIFKVNDRAFSGVPKLEHLSLRGTGISELRRGIFDPAVFPSLSLIDLTGNGIRRLETGVIEGLPRLRQLFLDGNLLETIKTRAITANPQLQLVSLQNNRLREIESGAFQDLQTLLVLLLANNTLPYIEAGVLSQLPSLQQLTMRGNLIENIHPKAFDTLDRLTTVDLGFNRIRKIEVGTLEPLSSLMWLDLRENRIAAFPAGSLPRRIPNLILSGNPIDCSRAAVTPLLTYLSSHNTRTTMPDSPPLTCTVPAQYAGKDLSELILLRANETFFTGLDNIVPGGFKPGGRGTNQLPLANIVPSLDRIPGVEPLGIPGINSPIPGTPLSFTAIGDMSGEGLNTVSRAVAGLADLPGINALVNPSIRSPGEQDDLLRTFHDFSKPLSKIVVGETPTAKDVENLLGTLPKMAQQLPTMPSIDLSKIEASPEVIRAFLKGEEIPGLPIPKSARDTITRQVLGQMSRAAEAANQGFKFLPDGTPVAKLLPELSALPAETVKDVLRGEQLPMLNAAETRNIRDYYTARFIKERTAAKPEAAATPIGPNADPEINQHVDEEIEAVAEKTKLPVEELMGVLGQDIGLVPDSIITSIARGEPLDLEQIPPELIELIEKKDPILATRIEDIINGNKETTERPAKAGDPRLLGKGAVTLPPRPGRRFIPSEEETFDIDRLRVELVDPNEATDSMLLWYTLIGLGVVAVGTVVAISALCWRRRAQLKKAGLAGVFAAPMAGVSQDEIVTDYEDDRSQPSPTPFASPYYHGWSEAGPRDEEYGLERESEYGRAFSLSGEPGEIPRLLIHH